MSARTAASARNNVGIRSRRTLFDYVSLYWELLPLTPAKRWILLLSSGVALFFLYVFGLTRMGLVLPDEPRYAAIGREMARSGDWITPRLWGKPWFEKPPLLYWTTAIGFKAGLGDDLAPRLPVALASVGFLIFFFVILRREFGLRAAFFSAAMLATSAGWLAYSHVAVPDLLVSATFSAVMLLLMRERPMSVTIVAGILLGAAILAKGLVPLALFIPAIWFLRRRLRDLVVVFAVAAIVALPWYLLMVGRYDGAFIDEFLWKQHFGRFASHALLHERPFWFYLPVLAAGLFPWTPLLVVLFRKDAYRNERSGFLVAWAAWGVVFFSIFLNKLPGYILPAFPAIATLLGIALAAVSRRFILMITLFSLCGALLWFMPAIQDLLASALRYGISHAGLQLSIPWILPALLVSIACGYFAWRCRLGPAIALVALVITTSVIRLVWLVFPVLDQTISARSMAKSHGQSITCVEESNRSLHYGLNYYLDRELPDCK